MDRLQRSKQKRKVRNEQLRKEDMADKVTEETVMNVFRTSVKNNDVLSIVDEEPIVFPTYNDVVSVVDEGAIVFPKYVSHQVPPTVSQLDE
jgi:hypothetical protein